MFLDSIHSDTSRDFVDTVSANIFCLPSIWAEDTWIPFSMDNIQSWLHVVDCATLCLFIYAIAVEL